MELELKGNLLHHNGGPSGTRTLCLPIMSRVLIPVKLKALIPGELQRVYTWVSFIV